MNLAHLCMTIPADTSPPALVIGAVYQGGFYAGQVKISGITYNLVISPRVSGQPDPDLLYQINDAGFDGNTSVNDGKLIQQNMVTFGISNFPQQQWAIAQTIGGFNDWYIPAKEELEIIYRNFKPTTSSNTTASGTNASAVPPTTAYTTTVPARTALTAFRSNGAETMTADYYFSATQGPSGRLYAHAKRFTNGQDSEDQNVFEYPIRLVRKVVAT